MSDHYLNSLELEAIITRLRDEENRWDAILELKLSDNTLWIKPLISYLKDPDWIIRWCVAEKLGDMRDLQSVDPLILTLADPDGHVVKNAFNALKKFGNEIVPLVLPYYGHANSNIRIKIHELFLELGSPIIPILRKELDKYQWVVGNRIVHLIWEIGKQNEENTLISCLTHKYAQKSVILLLGSLKSVPSLPHLIRLYQMPNLRRTIFYALRLIGKETSFPIVIHSLNNSALMASAEAMILKIGAPIHPYLVKELSKGHVSQEIVQSLIKRIGIEQPKTETEKPKKNFGLF